MGRVKVGGLKLMPWQSWLEWNLVREALFSSSPDQVSRALDKVVAWQSRGRLPVAVEVTAELINIQRTDPCFSNSVTSQLICTEEMLRLMYGMAVMRMVNGVVDQSRKSNSTSVAVRAEAAGLPRALVDIRHEVAHKELPGIAFLRQASKQALEWLKVRYWEAQKQTVVIAREHLKSKLISNSMLSDNDAGRQSTGSRKRKLLDATSKFTAFRISHKRSKEIIKLVKSAVVDTVSVLVDDGLLETSAAKENLLQGLKVIMIKLCSSVPQLTSLLLVRLIEKIAKSHGDDCIAPCSWPFDNQKDFRSNDLLGKNDTTSCRSGDVIGDEGSVDLEKLLQLNGNDYRRSLCEVTECKHLISWVGWILKCRSEKKKKDGATPMFGKPVTGNVSFKDLPPELLKELLFMCLVSKVDRASRLELVDLLTAEIEDKKLCRHAAVLAHLSSPPWKPLEGAQESFCEDSKAGDLKDSFDPQNSHEMTVKFADRFVFDNDVTELLLQRSQNDLLEAQKRFQAILTKGGILQGEQSLHSSHMCKESQSLGLWTVAKNWRPCVIGMLPSVLSYKHVSPSSNNFANSLEASRLNACVVESGATEQQVATQLDTCKGGQVVNNCCDIIDTKRKKLATKGDTAKDTGLKKSKPEIDQILCAREVQADEGPQVKKFKAKGEEVLCNRKTEAVEDPGVRGFKSEIRDVLHTGEAATFFKIPEQSHPANESEIEPNGIKSNLKGMVLLDGVFQTCQPEQFAAIQSAIHLL
eukprot:c23251_g1_i1 orf=1888-4143(+)